MRYLKRYNEGGGIPTNPLANSKTNDMLRHLSQFGENNERKYDTSDLLNILAFSKGAKPQGEGSMGGVDFNAAFSPAEFVSYRTKKKGDTRISDYNEDKGGYNPSVGAMGLKEGQLERLSGRALKGSEERDFRELLNDPTLLRYFMDMVEGGDMNFRKAQMGSFSPSKGGDKGVGTGGGTTGDKGKITEMIKDGIAYICMDGTCKPK